MPSSLPSSTSQRSPSLSYATFSIPEKTNSQAKSIVSTRNVLLLALGLTTMLLAIILPTTLVLLSRPPSVQSASIIGHGSGPGDILISHVALTNPSLKDPYFPSSPGRKTMATIVYPIGKGHCKDYCSVPYMPPATAKFSNNQFFGDESAGVFDDVTYKACCASDVALDPSKETLVVLEPAVGTSRLLYGGIANEIASHGFVVVMLDHPGDAGIVEWIDSKEINAQTTMFDGKIKLNPFRPIDPWNKTVTDAIDIRVKDINFLLQSLTDKSFVEHLLSNKGNFKVLTAFDNSNPSGIVGHGLGGAVATWMSANQPSKFAISVNMAGTTPRLTKEITTGQIVLFGRTGARRDDDIHWPDSWKYLKTKATEWTMQKGGVFDYSDLPGIVDLVGQTGREVKGVKGLGEIVNWRAFGVTAQFVRAYMAMQFRGQGSGNDLKGLMDFFYGDMVPYTPA